MQKYLEVLRFCPLFSDIEDNELISLLDCLSAQKKQFENSSFIFSAGDSVNHVGVVLSGRAHVFHEDFWGNRSILDNAEPGDMFGEAFSCAETEKLPVSVEAVESSEVLLIDYKRIITSCSSACEFHGRLIKNMLKTIAKKNVTLTQKIEILTQRRTKDKLMAYLSTQSKEADSNYFEIPFSRQELSEYLAVDRSAMSSELSKLQDEGILSFHKSRFELY